MRRPSRRTSLRRGSRRGSGASPPGSPRSSCPSAICAVTVWLLDRFLGIGGESALFFVGVLVVALLGGVAPAVLVGGAVRGAAELLPHRSAAHVHHRRARRAPSPIVVLLLVAVAVAALVDGAAKRAREARHASQEAELLALFAGSVLRGADLETLLERVRETYSQRAVSMLRTGWRTDGADRGRCVGQRSLRRPSIPPTPPSRSATTSSGC